MRASLLRTFDKIFIVDLHGSANKQERTPDGSKDENIFDIMQGVSLFVGVKTTTSKDWAKVYHADLWGLRGHKFENLEKRTLNFCEISPDSKMAYMIPQDDALMGSYSSGILLTELFGVSSAGMVLGRDKLCAQMTQKGIENVIDNFQHYETEALRETFKLGKDSQDWKVESAKNDILESKGTVTQIAYRPFDDRWTYYTGLPNGLHCRPRSAVMNHMVTNNANMALCFTRSDKSQETWSMVFVTNKITESCILTTQTSGIATVAPLYLHTPNDIDGSEWTPNLSQEAVTRLASNFDTPPEPIHVFDYCYGILNDPVYIDKYNDFLKRNYPRIPIPKSSQEFEKYIHAGSRLRRLHLMQETVPADIQVVPATNEDLEIGSIKYKDGVLHINSKKQLHGIPQDVWQYRIGGYQVLDKWFKSHKGAVITKKSLEHIMNMVGLLSETVKIRKGLLADSLHQVEVQSNA